MYSAQGDTALPVPGFPIRVSAGQSLFSSSPRLIAAVHALHRLLVPRHPPCALTILTVIVDNCDAEASRSFNGDLSVVWPCKCSFQGPARVHRGTPRVVSQNSAVRARLRTRRRRTPGLVDVLDAPRGSLDPAAGSLCELPRKEVIQPHLPVRLPCYDFTPITSPTFDGSLP
jgi:hypothetical protein